jgi:cell division protein FtsZ
VVATGIDADAMHQAPPVPVKVFAFPGSARPSAAQGSAPEASEPELPVAAADGEESGVAGEDSEDQAQAKASPTGEYAADGYDEDGDSDNYGDEGDDGDEEGDELLLGGEVAIESEEQTDFIEEVSEEPVASDDARPWMPEAAAPTPPSPPPARETGATLFERMSNLARGSAKAPADEGGDTVAERDPLDIPRFLNRQNNQ